MDRFAMPALRSHVRGTWRPVHFAEGFGRRASQDLGRLALTPDLPKLRLAGEPRFLVKVAVREESEMLLSVLALLLAGLSGPEWLSVHEDSEATTSIDVRAIGRVGQHRTVAVKTMFRNAEAGGFVHDIELDCAANRLRAVHESILNGRGERVSDGPALSPGWMTPPDGAPFLAVLRGVCSLAE
jgi:hypothetical protein